MLSGNVTQDPNVLHTLTVLGKVIHHGVSYHVFDWNKPVDVSRWFSLLGASFLCSRALRMDWGRGAWEWELYTEKKLVVRR